MSGSGTGHQVVRGLGDVIIAALLVLAVAMATGWLALQPLLSGSMRGFADRGDLIIATRTDAASVRPGDVVLFAPPEPWTPPGAYPVAHRILTLAHEDGRTLATTKGDANPAADPWLLDLEATRIASVRAVIPELGHPFIQTRRFAAPVHRLWVGGVLMAAALAVLARDRERGAARGRHRLRSSADR